MKKRIPARSQAGMALVEFALAVPVLMLLLVGLVETGRYAYDCILIGSAARAGVQYGAQNLTTALQDSQMQAAAKNEAQNIAGVVVQSGHLCQCSNGTTSTSSDCSQTTCPLSGYHRVVYVWVTATGSFTPIFNYPGLPAGLSVTREALMRVSQ
jgi:Flp pilus assembly protein TadG